MSDTLTIVTWNINSIRARIDLFGMMTKKLRPDVVLLQETRVTDGSFPLKTMHRRGFKHTALNGRGGHHGVAILSKVPLDDVRIDIIGGIDQSRHVSAVVDWGGPARLHSLYVPSGGDEPDVETNEKFRQKLEFVDGMLEWGQSAVGERAIVAGDFNIAPYPSDVWSHRQLLDVISHTPAETDRLENVRASQGWVDVVRRDRPEPQEVYTWWSYRNKTWPGSNRGRRLDHIWASPSLADSVREIDVLREARGWEKASDHVPVVARIER
ncbi:exodeoxyribonuclease III [Acuticoccus mangrovi]|uniref:Endonuclease/exonuclease/phosphatase family protein n=1 Tax=Acuticoccus mangrovi TaxID=2796142 RepID=A0A934IG08_9HYPH|nr:exodeoxyribonuclease III [Acuticoccus mangrovi]MBJ3775984.1 endonuclease/exonuclease/phosphatase family protein [Acuticoccus mangrovi]